MKPVASDPSYCRLAEIGAMPLVEAVAAQYRVRVAALLSRDRSRAVVRARHHLWMILRHTLCDYSLPELGRLFGVDHTTILYGVREAEARLLGEERAA